MNAPVLQHECQKADDLYRNRQDMSGVRESIRILSALTDGPSTFDVKWRLSRASFFVGQEQTDNGQKASSFRDGIVAGQTAVELEPDRVEGHFWLGVNAGLLAEVVGSLQALRFVRKAIKHLKRACEICPQYHGAGPLRVYARLKHKLPWPLGSRASSETLFRRAISLSPDNSVTRIYYAELLNDMGKSEDESVHLRTVIGMPDNEEWRFELTRDKAIASRRLGS
jgi:hypothetical protein